MNGQAGGNLRNGELWRRLAVHTAVEVDGRGLGGHGREAVFHLCSFAANQDKKTPFELERRERKRK